MKKNLLLFILIATFGFTASAQVAIAPAPVVVAGITVADADVVAHSLMTSNASEEKTYRWLREVISITDGWQSAICDKNACYFPNEDSKEVTFTAGEEGTMDVHVYPNGLEGEALIKITITDVADSTISASNLYYFNMTPSATTNIDKNQIHLYPNPTSGIFAITTNDLVKELFVYNLTGRAVRHFDAVTSRNYDIESLPRGNYIVRMIGKDGLTLTTKLLQKE